jgi:hypothetical protein
MPFAARPNETREMRLFSKVIEQNDTIEGATGDRSLPQFIARRRLPGDTWRTWDELRYELREVSGEIVTDGTVRRWARWYGIPETTQADGAGDTNAKQYAAALKRANIIL